MEPKWTNNSVVQMSLGQQGVLTGIVTFFSAHQKGMNQKFLDSSLQELKGNMDCTFLGLNHRGQNVRVEMLLGPKVGDLTSRHREQQ